MTTKVLSGVYNYGYSLSISFNAVSITDTGLVRGQNYFGYGYNGGTALYVGFNALANNNGVVEGGFGSQGAPTAGTGGTGGKGGIGVNMAGGTLTNRYFIFGGPGGAGGSYTGAYGNGGNGGVGGAAVYLGTSGKVINSVSIQGGTGGAGAPGASYHLMAYSGGNGGGGGAGVILSAGGTLVNTGQILGGLGGAAGPGGYAGFAGIAGREGFGVELLQGGQVTNGAGTATAALIGGGYGVYAAPGAAATVINFGTIKGAGPDQRAVGLYDGSDRLIVEPGSSLIGSAYSVGATLEVAGGSGSIALSGVLGTLSGGVNMPFQQFDTIILDTGANWTLTGPATTNGAQIIRVSNGATLGGVGSIANGGTIILAGGAANTDLRVQSPGMTLANGGTILMSGAKARILGASPTVSLNNVDNFIAGSGFLGANQLELTNESFGIIQANQGTLSVRASGAALVNDGLLESTATGLLVLASDTIDQSGGGAIVAAGKVDLQDDDVIGGSIAATGSGVVRVNVSGGQLDGTTNTVGLSGVMFVINGANETLAGSIANAGKINLIASTLTSDLIIGAAGATLSGGGQVNLTNSVKNEIYGLASADTLTNVNNRIDGAGLIGKGAMSLINQAGGQIVGNQNLALTIDTGANVITNAGLIENVGKGGTLVKSAVNNTGTLLAATAGTLTLSGAVTGAGVGQINAGTLYVQQAFAENVTFSGSTGVLELGDSQAFTGKITGLSKTGTSWLDLVDIGFFVAKTKATYSGTTASGILTVTDGTHTAHIALQGNYLASAWTLSGDGHGGTKVMDPLAGSLSQAMASAWAGPVPHLTGPRFAALPRMPTLHAQV